MKTTLLVLSLLLSAAPAFAKDVSLTGSKARRMMETLTGAGFDVKNLQEEWNKVNVLTVETKAFVCHASAIFPDGWLSDASCTRGEEGHQGDLTNSLALAQAIQPYAVEDDGLSNRWLAIENIRCQLLYNEKKYSCLVTTK